MNSVTQTNQMDCLVRYWDHVYNSVKVCFWKSSYLGHATHKDLQYKSGTSISSLNLSKMIQVSRDGPNVNIKFMEMLSKSRKEAWLPQFINFSTCKLHVIHGAFQTGALKSSWNIHKILKANEKYFIKFMRDKSIISQLLAPKLFPCYFAVQDGLRVEMYLTELLLYGRL